MIIYPPYIADSIPAFTQNKVVIPFAQNPAVSLSEVTGFSLMIKNYITSELITTITTGIDTLVYNTKTKQGEISFDLTQVPLIAKQYYKFQLGYMDQEGAQAYSIVAFGRCIGEEPEIYVSNLTENTLNRSLRIYQGNYSTTTISEPLYSYRFILTNTATGAIVQDSQEQIYNTNNDIITTDAYTSIQQRTSAMEFICNQELPNDTHYTLSFTITTVSGYKATKKYQIIEGGALPIEFKGALVVSQDHEAIENGYITIALSGTQDDAINGKFLLEKSKDGQQWELLTEFTMTPSDSLDKYKWRDSTIEQGVTYIYALSQKATSKFGKTHCSARLLSQPITVEFEHMFLSDGQKQLKIKYNPKVSSFKSTILESKTDTIGNKYPFFFRNGQVEYKEIPISGLISYQMDENQMFMSNEDLGFTRNSGENPSDLTHQNILLERKFKLAVLDWLNNGQLKLFRSPTEGNYVVRLMNTSLSPNDTLGRMLHTFSSTGYEAAAADQETLFNKKLVPSYAVDPSITTETVELKFEDLFKNNIEPVDVSEIYPALISGTIKNIIWRSSDANIKDTIDLNGETFANTTGLFVTPYDMQFESLIINYPITKELDDTITFTYDAQVMYDAEQDDFKKIIDNSYDGVKTYPIVENGTSTSELDLTHVRKIYAITVRSDPPSITPQGNSHTIIINGESIDVSDGQIRWYTDLPIGTSIIKGDQVRIDLYACLDNAAMSSKLGWFVLGESTLGLEA